MLDSVLEPVGVFLANEGWIRSPGFDRRTPRSEFVDSNALTVSLTGFDSLWAELAFVVLELKVDGVNLNSEALSTVSAVGALVCCTISLGLAISLGPVPLAKDTSAEAGFSNEFLPLTKG